MGSYDFANADKFGKKWLALFLAPCLRIWLFSGLDLHPWQKVDLATLRRNSARVAQCVTIGVVLPVVRISGTVIVRRV